MYPVNPQQLIQMIKSGQNPQQVLFSILQGQANTPIGANLLNLAKEGNTKEIERIVRNLYNTGLSTMFLRYRLSVSSHKE